MQDRFLDAVVDPSNRTKKVESPPDQSGSFLDSIVPSKYRQVTPDNLTTKESPINVDAYNPTKLFENIITKAQGSEKQNTEDGILSNLINPTLKAIPRVVTHTAASMQQMPISGIAALAKFISTGNLNAANKILEENQKVLDEYYLTTPEEKKAAENIGLAMKPFEMAGEGLKNIVELTPLKNTIAEPIAATIGETAALFGFGGAGRAVKGRVDKVFKPLENVLPTVSGEPYSFREFVKDTEPIIEKTNELTKAKEVVDNIPDEALKAAYEKVLETEKTQLELEAKALQDKIDHKKVVEDDLKAKGQEVKDIKEGKVEEEIELPPFDSDKEMLKSLGYEEEEIARFSPEEIQKILREDEFVESLNELKPAKSGEEVIESLGVVNAGEIPEGKIIDLKPSETVESDTTVKGGQRLKTESNKAKQPWNATMKSRLETVNQEVAQNRDKIIAQSRKQAEHDGWLDKWTPEKAIDDYYREHSGISTSGWKALKKGETWKGRLEKLAEKEKQTKNQPVTDLDLQTGAPLPKALEPSNHPFRDKDAKHTEAMKKLLQEKVSNVDASPEVFTRYLINEVNRWLNGEEVPIDKVRNGLSELAVKVDNLKNKFELDKDFTLWKDTVKEAARWARDVDRLKNKRTGNLQLNMMIPVNELPQMVKDVLKTVKLTVKDTGFIKPLDIYRNKEFFDKTGFWLGKDGKWRYEIDDSKLKIKDRLNRKRIDELEGQIKAKEDYLRKLKRESPDYFTYARIRDSEELDNMFPDVSGEIFRLWKEGQEVKNLPINDVIDYPEIFKSIPEIKQIKVTVDHLMENLGYYEPNTKTIVVRSFKDKDALIHELQHAVNDIVGSEFRGSDPGIDKKTIESYMKSPGEMEARLTEIRMDMTPEQRKAEPPWETLDRMLIEEGNKTSEIGHVLYTGIDPTQVPEATKKIIAGAKALAAYTTKARGLKEFKPSQAFTMAKEEFIRSGVDRSGNIRRELLDKLGNEGYEIIQKMYLSKGASSLAAQSLKQTRKEVYDGLSKNDKRILDNLILADRMLDIGKYKTPSQFKFPEGLSPVESAAYNELFPFIEKITPEKAEILKQRTKAYFEWMKKPLKDMLDEGLISQEEYNNLASHNYRRLKLVDVFDKRYQVKVGKTKRTVYDSGVEALSHGRETDVFEPSSEVMALEVFNRAYGRILNNAANKTLLNLARTQKDNPFVAVKESPSDHIPSGWDRIFVYENGERKALYLSPSMSKEWITNNPEMSYKMSQILRYTSGSPILRTFATGIDWGFALANLPRDIMHIWYAARVFEDGKWKSLYNTNLPIYSGQIAADVAGVFNDAMLRKGRYQDYIKEGGGMEFLVHQGRLMQRGRHIEGTLDKIQDFLGYFGETSEILTRLAVRDRVIKRRANEKGISYEEAYKDSKIRQEATFAARDYMDFGQGGGVSKALDNGLPYLNASIQGTRGIFRAFKDNPIESSYKLAQFAALTTGLYIANQAINPETMKALKGSVAMQGNLCIPLGDGFGFDDEKGQRHYPYIKIPLDPGQKFFKIFFEASYDKATGQQVDAAGVANSLSQISPVAISSLPPTLSGTLGYVYNKDFWLNDEIWKKTDKPLGWPYSKEEYIPGKTPQALIDVGEVTGLSPERLKYSLSELVTNGSQWAWLAGKGYDAAFGNLPKEKKEMHLAEVLSKTPIIKRFIGITNPYSQFAEPINEAKEQSMVKRWIENRGLDQRVESYLYEGGKRSEVIDYINQTAKDLNTRDRLKDRFIFSEKIKDLPNRSFWLSLKGITDTEARAKVFVDRYDSASQSEKEQLNKEIGIVTNAGGIISDEFKQQVMRVRNAKANK